MLLVAVVGTIGEGKSSTLAEFASALPETVDGFIAHAGDRDLPDRGASHYDLELIKSGERFRYATRQPVGYEVSAQAETKLIDWAQTFDSEVLVIDEFGKWEAEGKGHWPLWQILKEKNPRMVVIAVQQRAFAQLPIAFDVVLKTEEASKLIDIYHQRPDWERVGKFGAGAGAFEISVGSAFHASGFPLTGTVMSAAQAAFLAKSGERLSQKNRVVWVAFIASALKAFSPAGSKLGPMLAISMQGFLFTVASSVIGWNKAGRAVGGILMGAWAALQGFFIQYLLLGNQLSKAYKGLLGWTNIPLPGMIAGLAILNGFCAMILAIAMSRANIDKFQAKPAKPKAWTFLLPTLALAVYLALSGSKWTEIGLLLGRSLGVVALLYILVQRWNPQKVSSWLARRGHWGVAYALRESLDRTQPKSGS